MEQVSTNKMYKYFTSVMTCAVEISILTRNEVSTVMQTVRMMFWRNIIGKIRRDRQKWS